MDHTPKQEDRPTLPPPADYTAKQLRAELHIRVTRRDIPAARHPK